MISAVTGFGDVMSYFFDVKMITIQHKTFNRKTYVRHILDDRLYY